MLSVRSISTARTIWRSLARERALGARLEQARDLHGQGGAAGDDAALHDELARPRARARADRRHDVRGSACPHRRAASRDSADRRSSRVAGSRQRPSAVAKGRNRWPSRSTTRVENSRSSPSGAGRARRPSDAARRPRAGQSQRARRKRSAAAGVRRAARRARLTFVVMSRASHRCVTSTVPVAVRPKRSGRYMSST